MLLSWTRSHLAPAGKTPGLTVARAYNPNTWTGLWLEVALTASLFLGPSVYWYWTLRTGRWSAWSLQIYSEAIYIQLFHPINKLRFSKLLFPLHLHALLPGINLLSAPLLSFSITVHNTHNLTGTVSTLSPFLWQLTNITQVCHCWACANYFPALQEGRKDRETQQEQGQYLHPFLYPTVLLPPHAWLMTYLSPMHKRNQKW